MDNVQWIKNLVLAEQEMEESGIVDLSSQPDAEKIMESETHDFLQDIKTAFVQAASSFNQFKDSSLGTVKVYGIAKTKSDFMLFRNGYKLIFSMRHPGQIGIDFQNMGSTFRTNHSNDETAPTNETILTAQWGAFGDLKWSYQGHSVQLSSLVQYYLTQFIRESAR